MNAATRVAGFVLGIAAIFGIGLAAGNQVGAVGQASSADAGHDTHAPETEQESAPDVPPGGLMVSDAGFTLALRDSAAPAGRAQPVAFKIEGADGPVTSYAVEHEKEMHLVAVRRDFTGFQHVHPELAADGTWTTDLDLTPGQWRLFADFRPTGADALTLGADLSVAGRVTSTPQPRTSRVAQVDGYTVTLAGDLVAGQQSKVKLTITRDGRPVPDLQPYLGAFGHLVALRSGDLAYLHVHPDGEPRDGATAPGPEVEFRVEVPSTGSYHLYLDFRHDGVVRTAQFALGAEDL